MPRRPEQEMSELDPGAVRKDAVAKRLAALSAGAIQVESLDGKILRGVAVDLDIGLLGKRELVVGFAEFDVHRALPFRTALGIVASRGVAGDVNANRIVEEVRAVGGQREDWQGVTGAPARVDPECAGGGRARKSA